MITLCTVTLDRLKDKFEAVLIESILEHCTLVNEVILANNDRGTDYREEWKEGKITFRRIGANEGLGGGPGEQHAFGLHIGIDNASNDLIYLCDPDVFFLSAADEFFYNVKNKYKLDVIGCSHHSATELCGKFFPWHGSVLMNKSKLPGKDWIKEDENILGCPGKWLTRKAGQSQKHLYPYPDGNFDTASALWLWAHQQNWSWMSFLTPDAHLYTTKFYRASTKISERFKLQKLIYHAVSGSIIPAVWEPYKATYDSFKKEKESEE